jgi:hypothetical protein
MSVTTLALKAEVPALDECGWAEFESWLVAMREELPAAALAAALDEAQERLIDSVCGPKWMPTRGLAAPFACPRCQVNEDFARKGRRSRPRKIHTATGVVELRLWNVGCRGCGRVFAPMLFLLGLHNKRRTDRLTVDLAELGIQMSFGRAAKVASSFGVSVTSGRTHHALADVAGILAAGDGLGPAEGTVAAPVVLLDGTGVRAGANPRGTSCNIALALDTRRGPRHRRRAGTRLLAVGVDDGWTGVERQLRDVPAPALAVVDGEAAITDLVQRLWPSTPIQRCWWHLPRGLRQAIYADRGKGAPVKQTVNELADLLRDTVTLGLNVEEALDAYDTFRATVSGSAATAFLREARPHAFTCLDPILKTKLAAVGGPELGTGVLERLMRELNARTDIGGSRWSSAGIRDLINVLLARRTNHPAWNHLWRDTHQPNAIPFSLAKFNAC